ncbi:YdeI/OmpD-associated family protein [Candidatus Uhrbacteria bacterium]|nr:YdeI/OmpD-associated family protein [Candidatus Uhrbacteria bacterium]
MPKTTQKIATGVVHTVPADLRKALTADSEVLAKWNDLTPLARNEWICWVTYVKQAKTRQEHVERAISQLKEGERRPCCWPGCPHRNANAKKWFEPRKKKLST